MEESKEKCPSNNGHKLVILYLDEDTSIVYKENEIILQQYPNYTSVNQENIYEGIDYYKSIA